MEGITLIAHPNPIEIISSKSRKKEKEKDEVKLNANKKKPKGLVLSGGSIRGIVQLGALHYLESIDLLDDITH